ncbi:T9SS type A sorting domain-containing protein [candidate division KSB1 bacterium]|nr:T9SS type A sorting domain-containing protein [candidate division KSB1 bacterium]
MNITAKQLLLAILLLSMASAPYALNYMYFSDTEVTVLNQRIPFETGDTLDGPIRTNEQFTLAHYPVFYGYVIQSADSFLTEGWTNPHFGNPDLLVFGAPTLPWPENANWHREQAIAADHYLDQGDTMRARVRLNGDSMRVWFAGPNQVFDSVSYSDYPLGDSSLYWIQAPIEVSGTVSGTLILCTSLDAGLADNTLYTSSDPVNGRPDYLHPEKFALITEGSIVILNTPANGRENSSHGSHIALNGLYVALGGSFTFAEQNDLDSGYVCECAPDNRGYIFLWGGIAQRQAGYTHRSNRTSTGYRKYYRGDRNLTYWSTGLFSDVAENVIEPATLEFDTISIGQHDTLAVRFTNAFVPLRLTDITVNQPFLVDSGELSEAWTHDIRVVFAPTTEGTYTGTLSFRAVFRQFTFTVPLHGVAVGLGAERPASPLPDRLTLSVYPNPFNSVTTLRYSLSRAEHAELLIVDVNGRQVERFGLAAVAGEHSLTWDARAVGTGIYFARLTAGAGMRTEKLLLLK